MDPQLTDGHWYLLQWNQWMCQSVLTQRVFDLSGNTKTSRKASVLALLSHKQQICSFTARDGVYGPWEIKALLLLQCCLQARAICGSEWKAIELDHSTDQHKSPNEWTKDLCKIRHSLHSVQREKRRWEAWESRGICTFYVLATTEQHCSVIQDTKSSKRKEHLWANRTWTSLQASSGAVLWHGPQWIATNQMSLWHDDPWDEGPGQKKISAALASF